VETIKGRIKKFSDEKKYEDSLQEEREKEELLQSLEEETGEKREKIKLIISAILSELLVGQTLINKEKMIGKIGTLFGINVSLEILEKVEKKLYLGRYIINNQITEEGKKFFKSSSL